MFIDKEFEDLWRPDHLPERIHSGSYVIFDWEREIIINHINGFFEYIKKLGHVPLLDFCDFLEFLATLGATGDEDLTDIVIGAMILVAKMRWNLECENQGDNE